MFLEWIKEGEEHQRAFETTRVMQIGTGNLGGNWKLIRKTRLVRLIRKMIEEGIIRRGVQELYEEGCRILSKMERGSGGKEDNEEEEKNEKEEEEEEEKEKERYMHELSLLRFRGRQKLKVNEVSVLIREVEEERRKKCMCMHGEDVEILLNTAIVCCCFSYCSLLMTL